LSLFDLIYAPPTSKLLKNGNGKSSYDDLGPDYLDHTEDAISKGFSCNSFGWAKRSKRVRIYYAIIFGNELRVLDILLHEVNNYVDKIFMIEASRTMQNRSKLHYLQENKDRLRKFKNLQIISLNDSELSWEVLEKSTAPIPEILLRKIIKRGDNILGHRMEWAQRGYMAKAVLNHGIANDDIVIFADADEIISAEMLSTLRRCKPREKHFNVCLQNFVYGFACPGPNNWYGNSIRTGESFLSSIKSWDKNPLTLPTDPKFTQRSQSRAKFCTLNNHPKPSYYLPINLHVKNFGWHLSSFTGYDSESVFRLRDKYLRSNHIGLLTMQKDEIEIDLHRTIQLCTLINKAITYNNSIEYVRIPWYVKKNPLYFENVLSSL